jgi:mannose-6-phosphate isomerase-like protein (cupin superfamily)
MVKIETVDVATCSVDILRNLSIVKRERLPGSPARIDGMTVGIVTMTEDAPHGGEVHPDGDEFLYVMSGRIRITTESDPDFELTLGAGEACIVPKDLWHKVSILEETQLFHMTPGPNGDHRPAT